MDWREVLSLFRFREVRKVGRAHRGWLLGLPAALAYVVVALYFGFDLFFVQSNYPYSLALYTWNGQLLWWYFPYVEVLTPYFQLALPLSSAAEIGITGITVGWAVGAAWAVGVVYHRKETQVLSVPLVFAFALLGAMSLAAPVTMDGLAYSLALSDATAWITLMYAWYLPLLEIVGNILILLFLELRLRGLKLAGLPSSRRRALREPNE